MHFNPIEVSTLYKVYVAFTYIVFTIILDKYYNSLYYYVVIIAILFYKKIILKLQEKLQILDTFI